MVAKREGGAGMTVVVELVSLLVVPAVSEGSFTK
jgi:hypothetical protein